MSVFDGWNRELPSRAWKQGGMSTIGGNFNPSQINQQFQLRIQKGDSPEAQSALANTGTQAEIAKDDDEGVRFSNDAMKTLGTEPKQLTEHAAELAQQSGVAQANDQNEADETRERRDQGEVGEKETPDGYVSVSSAKGAKQLMTVDEHANLKSMDHSETTEENLYHDIPESNLKAAAAMVKTQTAQGVSKVANLKTDPAVAEAASKFERQIAGLLAEPLDIRQPGNDRLSLPMQLEQHDPSGADLEEKLREEAAEASKDWAEARAALTAPGQAVKSEMLLHNSIASRPGVALELALCQALHQASQRTLDGQRRLDADLGALLDKHALDPDALEGELQSRLAVAKKQFNPLKTNLLTEAVRSASLLGHTLRFEQTYREIEAAGTDPRTVRTALTTVRRDNLEQVSNAAWAIVNDSDLWKAAGLTPDDLRAVQQRVMEHQSKLAHPGGPLGEEVACLAMADQLAAVSTQRLEAGAPLTPQQAQALKGLQTAGTQYVETRGAMLQL